MLRVAAQRTLSTSSRREADLIQQAFVKKVREYAQKGGDLVNSNAEVKKSLQDELNRLAQKFQLASADVVSKIPTSFQAAKVESSVGALLEGKSIAALTDAVKKEKTDYLAARDAKKKAEAARAAALKGN